MDELRTLLAVTAFSISCFLIYDLFSTGFSIYVFIAVFVFYWLAYLLLPKDRDSDRSFDPWDLIDIIIRLPYRIISASIRGLSKSDGLDIDFDL